MALYGAGQGTATPATTDNAYAALWNLGSTPIWLVEFAYMNRGSTNPERLAFKRISARGTQTATQLGEPFDPNDAAGTNGTLDSAYSVQPTVTGNYLRLTQGIINNGNCFFFRFAGRGLRIAGGAGLALVNPQTVATDAAMAYAIWDEPG